MKEVFRAASLPPDSLFITCANHEDRCSAIASDFGRWRPRHTIVFVYGDASPATDAQAATIRQALGTRSQVNQVMMPDRPAIESIGDGGPVLQRTLSEHGARPVVLDASVLTKRHLLMLLRWLDDRGYWDSLWIVYAEPADYDIDGSIALSFGLSSVRQLPGFPTAPNPSRPLHLVLFLGYEGERAFGTYAVLQPQKTTVVVPYPPFQSQWEGRTETRNENLLTSLPSGREIEKSDAVDPTSSKILLERIFGPSSGTTSPESRAVCPLGTKPQALGMYSYVRECIDPPAVIYAGVLRHNHVFYTNGVGRKWLIQRPD